MRILYVLPEYPPHFGGGIATFYKALLPEMVRQGHDVDVLVGSAMTSGEAPFEREGVRVSFLETEKFERLLPRLSQFEALPGLRRHLAAAWAMHEQADGGTGYDAVEVVDWGLLFAPWVAEARAPVIVQLHGSCGQIDLKDPTTGGALEGHVTRLFETALLRDAPVLHTHSRQNQREWEIATGRAVGYAPPPLAPETRAIGATSSTGRGLVVGRVQKWKGPEVLCDALHRLGDRAPEVDWVGRDTVLGVTGESMAQHLREQYPDVWGDRIMHLGQQAPARIAAMQAGAAFVVVPSLWDMFNLTAAEAMRAGNVVVCSTGAGASDLIEDGVNGFTFPWGDGAVLAERLAEVASLAPERRSAIGRAARETVARELSPSAIARAKLDAYRSADGTERRTAHEWAVAAVRPTDPAAVSGAFLDQQPLAGLLSYSLRRLGGRLVAPIRSAIQLQ